MTLPRGNDALLRALPSIAASGRHIVNLLLSVQTPQSVTPDSILVCSLRRQVRRYDPFSEESVLVPGLTLKATFRPAAPADGPAINALLAQAFPGETAMQRYDADLYFWKYWRPRADWPGPRSFVLTRGDEILAHAGVVPGRCIWRGGQFNTMHLIDWVAKPGSVGAGTSLIKQLGRTTDSLLAIGGSATARAILPALGFRSFGEASKFRFPLRPLRDLAATPGLSVKPVLRAARDLVQQIGTVRHPGGGWGTRQIAPQQLADLQLPPPHAGEQAAGLERSAAMLDYLLACPTTPAKLYQVQRDGGSVSGYFLLAFAGRQARLADCWIDSDDPKDWRALVQLALQAARQDKRIVDVVAVSNRPILTAGLADSGFREGLRQPVRLLIRPGIEMPKARLEVQMLDNDAPWMPH